MPLMTIFFMCKVMFYQLLSELLLITQGPPTTWRLPGWSQILAGEVERSDLEEAVGDNLPLRVSWLQESSSYHMPEDIQSCWAGSGQWPNGLIAKGGHRGCSLFSFSKTGSILVNLILGWAYYLFNFVLLNQTPTSSRVLKARGGILLLKSK